MSSFLEYFQIRPVEFKDVIEIIIVWFVIYQLFCFMSGTRTKQMAFGLLSLFFVQILADKFRLVVLSKAIGSLFGIIPVAIIVLFQREIRRMLASIGSNPFASRSTRSGVLDSIFQAALKLAGEKTGALIVLEGDQGLRELIEGGTRLDAVPSTELLVDIFQTSSLLHDGAVIVSQSRIASAACLMPLSRNPNLPRRYGTRHRAAIGITEDSDCIALVVSEETGTISFGHDGILYPVKDHTMSMMYETYNSLQVQEGEAAGFLESLTRYPLTSKITGKNRAANDKGAEKNKDGAKPDKKKSESGVMP